MTTLTERDPAAPPPVPVRRATTVVRVGPASGRLPWLQFVVPAIAAVLVVAVSAASITRGDYPISFVDVLRVFIGLGEDRDEIIVLKFRAPRIVVGVLVGSALGIAGALFQTFARNPLASPDILGITTGASVGAVAVLVLGGSATGDLLGGLGVPLAALIGALLTGALLFALAWRSGIDGFRLVLVGIALFSLGQALVEWLLTRAKIYDAQAAYVWITGSLNNRTWDQAVPLAIALAVLIPLALSASRALAALQFSDDTVRGLGIRLAGTQGVVVLIAVVLTAAAVSAAGPISFVALVVPQIAVRSTGGSRPPLLASGLLGALLVASADLLTRTVLPEALPVGILTAVVGAPYLLWLLVRGRRRATL